MKTKTSLVAGVCSVILGFVASVQAQAPTSLPFPVSVGGQAATAKAGEPFAKIGNPVAADAAVEVTTKSAMTIINVTPYDLEKKTPVVGGATAVILLQGSPKGTLAGTMDKQKLKPGNYLMSVVADGATDSVLLQIK